MKFSAILTFSNIWIKTRKSQDFCDAPYSSLLSSLVSYHKKRQDTTYLATQRKEKKLDKSKFVEWTDYWVFLISRNMQASASKTIMSVFSIFSFQELLLFHGFSA